MLAVEQKLIKTISAKIYIKNVSIGSYRINYSESGFGKPLILLHGANCGWGQWYKNIDFLSKYFKVYALDFPGSGNSTKIDLRTVNLHMYIEIVNKFIDKLSLHNPFIIGHSIGAWVGINLAIQHKSIEKLILVNPIGFSSRLPFKYRLLGIRKLAYILSETVMKPNRKNMKNFLVEVMVNKDSINAEYLDYYVETMKLGKGMLHPFFLINNLTSITGVKNQVMINDNDISKISLPILLILSDRDPLTDYKSALLKVKRNPNIETILFKNIGHVPPLENSIEFNSTVLNFLNK